MEHSVALVFGQAWTSLREDTRSPGVGMGWGGVAMALELGVSQMLVQGRNEELRLVWPETQLSGDSICVVTID